jgi:hypothetical protein
MLQGDQLETGARLESETDADAHRQLVFLPRHRALTITP